MSTIEAQRYDQSLSLPERPHQANSRSLAAVGMATVGAIASYLWIMQARLFGGFATGSDGAFFATAGLLLCTSAAGGVLGFTSLIRAVRQSDLGSVAVSIVAIMAGLVGPAITVILWAFAIGN